MPDWVPDGARRYVSYVEWQSRTPMLAGDELVRLLAVVQRLATAPKMKYVWKELESCRVTIADPNGGPDVMLHKYGVSDEVHWQFFRLACEAACNPPKLRTENEHNDLVAKYSTAAALCRHGITQQYSPELAAALARVAEHFEGTVRMASLNSPLFPLVVKYRTKDDEARAYVRVLGCETHTLFGATQYGIVAIVASIALNRKISKRQVRGWCA